MQILEMVKRRDDGIRAAYEISPVTKLRRNLKSDRIRLRTYPFNNAMAVEFQSKQYGWVILSHNLPGISETLPVKTFCVKVWSESRVCYDPKNELIAEEALASGLFLPTELSFPMLDIQQKQIIDVPVWKII